MLILVETLKKKSILAKLFEYLSFGQVIGNFDFGRNFFENHDFSQILEKFAL